VLTTAHTTLPLAVRLGHILRRPVCLDLGEARLTIEVSAVRDVQFAIRNHIGTDGAVPLFLEGIGHLLERCLDVFGDGGVGQCGVDDVVLDDRTVMVGVGRFVVFCPRKGDPLTGGGELCLKGRNGRCGCWHLAKYNKGGSL